MSVELTLYRDDIEIMEFSFVRSPFGIPTWATDNAQYKKLNYIHLQNIVDANRSHFKDLVYTYKNFIMNLEHGYFFFDTRDLIAFLEPKIQRRCNEFWTQTVHYENKLGIPMDWFEHGLAEYKDWFMKLVILADLYQNPETTLLVDK